jgi:hypothetical protein
VPYNDSTLTRLLGDSLGGNCSTTVLAMLSPSQSFCKQSNATLGFAHSCKQIQNVIKPNIHKGSIPAGIPFNFKVESTMQKLKQKKSPWDDMPCDITEHELDTKQGKIWVNRAGSPNDPVVLWSNFTNMNHIIPALVYCGYQVVEIYQPGYGKSKGKAWPTRCEQIMAKGGPADITLEVI